MSEMEVFELRKSLATLEQENEYLKAEADRLRRDNEDLAEFKSWSVDRNNELLERCRFAEREAREVKGNLAELEKYLEDLER